MVMLLVIVIVQHLYLTSTLSVYIVKDTNDLPSMDDNGDATSESHCTASILDKHSICLHSKRY